MNVTRNAMIQVLTRGLRKMKTLSRPVPLEFIFTQFANSKTLRLVTADRTWQRDVMESFVKSGAITRTKEGKRDVYLVSNAEELEFFTNYLSADDGMERILNLMDQNPGPQYVYKNSDYLSGALSNIRSAQSTSLIYASAIDVSKHSDLKKEPEEEPVSTEPQPPTKRKIVTGKWQQELTDSAPDLQPEEPVPSDPIPSPVQEFGLDDFSSSIHSMANETTILRAEQAEPVPPPPKSEPKPLASDYKYLTDTERQRIQLVEEALIRFTYNEWYERTDLFPGDFSPSEAEWQRKTLALMVDAGVIQRKGERRGTRYHGIADQASNLYEDSQWLLKLVMPSVLGRGDAEDDEIPESEDDLADEEASADSINPEPTFDPVEAILKSLESQVSYMAELDSRVSVLDAKLDEILKLLRGSK